MSVEVRFTQIHSGRLITKNAMQFWAGVMSIQRDVALNGLYGYEQLINDHNQIGYNLYQKSAKNVFTMYEHFNLP